MYGRRSNVGLIIVLLLMIVMAVICTVGIVNRKWLIDYFRGLSYQPVGEMGRIQNDLKLTDRGEFLFKAAQPRLNERTEFNSVCRSAVDAEVAVLGCYTGGNIYVYNIESNELSGIRELTTAHELLHAVWARMDGKEKADLKASLEKVYRKNKDVLEDDLSTYDETERLEELYVRAGTEVADLPADLEKHYAEIFKDQDLIVEFYNSYIAVFRKIEADMDNLKAEMDGIEAQIDQKTDEYEIRVEQLSEEVEDFNACARVEGCFNSEAEFYARRDVLIAEEDSLEVLYNEINGLVAAYNERVERYNADITRHDNLSQIINSNVKPQGIE